MRLLHSDTGDGAAAVCSKRRPGWRIWVSRRILNSVRRGLPELSATEREAIAAGTVGWEGTLFRGRPDWNAWLQAPPARITDEEQAFLDGPVERLCAQLDDWDITHRRHDLPPEIWRMLKEQGFFGLAIPKSYGGREFSPLAQSSVVMKIASRSLSAAVTAMVPNSIGPAKLLLHYGTPEQKSYWLPRLAHGEEIPCFALTGPTAGSDASAIPDTGVVCVRDGRLGLLLDWEKRYITLGPVATVLGLAFKLRDPDGLLGGAEGITIALVPAATPGVEIGRRHSPLDQAFQNGPSRGRNVFIPVDHIIGGTAYAGRGWFMLMETLAGGRAISLPALSVGAAKLCARAVGAYAVVRQQFHQPIACFEGVAERLGRIAGYTWLTDSARRTTAAAAGRGEQSAVVSAVLKQNLTECMRDVVNDAMDILAGKGIMMGPRNFLGRLYQAIPIAITVEGANILTRGMIIFGQGAVRCHPFLLAEMQAAVNPEPEAAERDFQRALAAHARYLLGTLFRVVTRGRTHPVPVGPGRVHYRQINRLSAAFALASQWTLLCFRGHLKRHEAVSGRLADAFSHLYLAACALKRFEEDGARELDLPLLNWSCGYCLARTEAAIDGLIVNLPDRAVPRLLRLLVFPFGRRSRQPDDASTIELAHAVTAPGALRDGLTDGIYWPTRCTEALAVLERAFQAGIAAAEPERKLRQAVRDRVLADDDPLLAVRNGILTEQEAKRIEQARLARLEALQVDDFAPDLGEEDTWEPPTNVRTGSIAGDRYG